MKNVEHYLEPYEDKNNKEKGKKLESKGNNILVEGLGKLVTPENKQNYATYKYEDPSNKGNKYNVGVQKLHDGFSVLLMKPKNPNSPDKGKTSVLKGVFKPNKAPEFSEIETGKDGVINSKKMPSNPQVAKNFAAIINGLNPAEAKKEIQNEKSN